MSIITWVEHVLAYDLLWQANNPVGIFEYEARCTRRHLEEVIRDNEQHLTSAKVASSGS